MCFGARQNDVLSVNPHTGQTERNLSYEGGVRSIGGIYQKDLVRTSVSSTNVDGTLFEDHSASYSKGFHFPDFGGIFRVFIITDIPCIPQAPSCYQPSYRGYAPVRSIASPPIGCSDVLSFAGILSGYKVLQIHSSHLHKRRLVFY